METKVVIYKIRSLKIKAPLLIIHFSISFIGIINYEPLANKIIRKVFLNWQDSNRRKLRKGNEYEKQILFSCVGYFNTLTSGGALTWLFVS